MIRASCSVLPPTSHGVRRLVFIITATSDPHSSHLTSRGSSNRSLKASDRGPVFFCCNLISRPELQTLIGCLRGIPSHQWFPSSRVIPHEKANVGNDVMEHKCEMEKG